MTSVVSIKPATLAAFCNARAPWSVDDTGLDHVHILFRRRVVAGAEVLVVAHLLDDDRTFHPGIERDLTDRSSRRGG